jgi:glucan phosphoethanolaminetransferase (alkaline phosphatase superfamily)
MKFFSFSFFLKIYNFCVFSIVIFVLVAFQAGTREVTFVLRGLLLLIGLGIIVGVLFIPKLHFVRINYSGGSVYSFFTSQKAEVRKWQARADALQNLLTKHNVDFSEIEVEEYIKTSHPDVWKDQHPSKSGESKSDAENIDMTSTKTDRSSTDA